MLLSEQDHQRIRAAVEAAERRTSGEICCVLARECSDYWEVPLAWAAGAAFIFPAAGLMLGLGSELVGKLGGGWVAAHAAAMDVATGQALTAYATIQALLFVLVALVVSIPGVRRLVTPAPLKHERVRRRAQEQFAARGLHLTKGRTGVLIFASLAERRAEVIADVGIASQTTPETWRAVVDALTAGMKSRDPGEGFAAAIAAAAEVLEQHAPRRHDDRNELPNTVIELDL